MRVEKRRGLSGRPCGAIPAPHIYLHMAGCLALRFLLESVADVRRSLRAKGSDLVIRIGKPEEVVPELVRSLPDVSAVYLQREARLQ